MKRFIVFDRQLQPLFDLDGRITEAMRYERINGEHKLDVKTTQPLEEGLRVLVRDGTLKWREWVVDEPDEHKQDYDIVEGSYGCTWSVQYDLSTVSGGELWPGTYTPITAGAALAMVLATQSRWEVGRVTVTGTAGTSLFDGSVWDYLGKLQEVWGGEIEPRIEVDSNGVAHRYVDWLAHVGSEEATRRFDYGEDCTGISRKPPVGPMFCRIVPRGGRDATDEDGISYSERVGVEEEPYSSGDGWVHDAGSIWIRDPDAEQNFRTPNPDGTWHYPELVVTYDTDDPEELVWLASADIHKYTRPSPTYEADVLQFAAAGMDAHGVELGDVVHIVDRKFGDAPLRIEARIVEMTVNELDESDVQLVIGEVTQGIESAFKSMRSAIDAAEERVRVIQGGGTIVYLQHLLDEINAEINGTGGYSYLVPGEGIITYDRGVADPLIGTEATQVTQIKGGNIRIANTKKPSFSGINDWNWKTVIVSGHVAAELVTAAEMTAGYIGSPDGDIYINFDTHSYKLGAAVQIGDRTVQQALSSIDSTITGVNVEYAENQSTETAPTSGWSTTAPAWRSGYYIWQRTATTTKNGTTYSQATCISGRDGTDGDGVSLVWNLLRSTEFPTSESTILGLNTSIDSDGTIRLQGSREFGGSFHWNVDYLDWDEYGSGTYTLSFKAKSYEGNTYPHKYISVRYGFDKNASDHSFLGVNDRYNVETINDAVTSEWSTYSVTFTSPDDLTSGSASALSSGSNLTIDIETPYSSKSLLIREVKLERGTEVTPWAPSLSDMNATGIVSIVEQYYLSNSDLQPVGGSWSNTQPAWVSGKYIWTRSQISWTDGTTTTTTPVLAGAINSANESVYTLDNSLNQQEIFNRLTNNGQTQGIYLQDGKVYINASYIKSGTINGDYIRGGTIEGTVLTSKSSQFYDGSYYQTSIHNGCVTMTYPGGATGNAQLSAAGIQVGSGTNYAGFAMATKNPSTDSPYGLGLTLSPDVFRVADASGSYATPLNLYMDAQQREIAISNSYANQSGGNMYIGADASRFGGYYASTTQYIEFGSDGVKIRSGTKGMKLSLNSNTWTPIIW